MLQKCYAPKNKSQLTYYSTIGPNSHSDIFLGHLVQSGNTQHWRISPALEKSIFFKLEKFSRTGEMPYFDSHF